MPNQYVNKVVKSDGTTLIDLTSDTVTSAAHIVAGHVGHLADGSQVAGTAPKKHTATVTARTNSSGGYVRYIGSTGTQYKTIGDTFEFNPGEVLYVVGMDSWGLAGKIIIDGVTVASGGQDSVTYTYTLPDHDISLSFSAGTTSIEEASSVSLQSKSVSYTPSETVQSATVTADSGYDGLSSVAVSVGAISSSYVGSGIDRRSSSDLTASGATVTVPSGYYASQATKSVASGTEGTPTATKGSVSNHSVSVTPSVTNSAGYISGGTKTGTAVTVSASELVSGSETKTENGTYDVTNLASIVIDVPSSGGSTLGTKTITENGTFSASADGYDGYSSVTVNVPTGGSSGIKIGIETTPIPNILNMFYALENGTAKTGEFTLSQAIPNTSTLILDTGLSTVNGLFIADESQATRNTGNTPENTLWAIVFNPGSSTGAYAMTRFNIQMGYGTNTAGTSRGFLNRVSAWEVTNGKLYATGSYNRNNNYTPFYPGHTYRWVAW